MTITDAELAALCAQSYFPAPTIEIGTDLAATITETDVALVVAFRGTANVSGWVRDFDAIPKSHDLLGYCHSGFLSGGAALWRRLTLQQDKSIILTGHSLGGALAAIVGGLRLTAAERMDALVTFGAPRAGYIKLAALYVGKSVRQYLRGNDPVPDVPLDLPAFPYKHIREPLIAIGRSSPEPWLSHDIRGYQTDLMGQAP